MTMSQVVSEPQAGPMSLSNGCDLATKHNNMEPMDLSAGPATSDDRMHVDEDVPGQLCRRSTRVSALKAQEKIKLKDDITGQEPGPAEETAESKEESSLGAPPSKKAKIAEGKHLDQMAHTFYIQEQADGTIVEVEEESDISSINSADAVMLKQAYEKIKAKEPSEETLRERNAQLRELEANLRREESDLCLIKKIRTSQLIAQNESKKAASAMNLSNGNGAYKPTMAAGKNGAVGAKQAPQITNDAIKILLQLTPEQQKDFIIKANKSNPAVIQQLVQAIAKSQLATQSQIQQLAQSIQAAHNVSKISTTPAPAPAPKPDPQATAASLLTKSMAQATPEQRAAQARQAFRIQADKQLQQLISSKQAHADLQFIPNPNQADFCALVALDIIVQRILKDKSATADVSEAPYECEECHTDFTPSWKAIGVPGDMHLYCEACVKTSQKKKALKDHTVFMRKAFNKVSSQEKEFEKHIADGKLEQFLSQAMAANQQTGTASTSTAQNLSMKTNGTSTPSSAMKSSAIPNTSKMSATSTSTSSAKKTTSSSSSSSANSMNMSQMQMAMLMRANPLMATAMMSQMNQSQMMQIYNPMVMQMMLQMQQQAQQQANRSSSNSSASQQQQSNYAMLAMAQAAMNAGAGGGSSSLGNLSAAQMSQLMQNPQLQRQLQEMMRLKAQGAGKK